MCADETASAKRHAFQADVRQVLDIVIHSLYTHREIFIRELISNAADALEKLRYEKVQNADIADPDLPLEIRIDVDEEQKTLTISDTGIGMTEDDAVENLGSIAHSGTREFVKRLKESGGTAETIGQFGVGFYSAFMAGHEVVVQSRSFKPEASGVEWRSDGGGEYSIGSAPALSRGTRIVIHLREDAHEFASKDRVQSIITQYSNFVPFPIVLNGETVNTVQALWTKSKNEIKDEDYAEFYKFIANDSQDPRFRLHFSVDAPLQINALLFVPQDNLERYGFGKLDPGVNLYCKKVLIQEQSEAIMPDWLRFIKGVVDSEDLPLNISRETMQDNALVRKLKKVAASRLIKFFKEKADKDAEAYLDFWKTFGIFLKEGAATDADYREELAPLLRFESSKEDSGTLVSLADYAARTKADQTKIYYAYAPNRAAIEHGPYIEAFDRADVEVLYIYEPVDEFVFNSLREFDGKMFTSADQADLDLPDAKDEDENRTESDSLSHDDAESLAGWLKATLGERIGAVKESRRLVDSPAILVNPNAFMTTGMQRIMKNMNQEMPLTGTHNLEINPGHPIIRQLAQRRTQNADDPFLKTAAEQIYETARIAAGMDPDPQSLIQNNYAVLEQALKQ